MKPDTFSQTDIIQYIMDFFPEAVQFFAMKQKSFFTGVMIEGQRGKRTKEILV